MNTEQRCVSLHSLSTRRKISQQGRRSEAVISAVPKHTQTEGAGTEAFAHGEAFFRETEQVPEGTTAEVM